MRGSTRSWRCLMATLTVSLTFGSMALAGPAGAGAKWHVDSSGKATGQYSLANTNTEVMNPVKIEVVVTAGALVQWSMECVKGSTIVQTKGKKTLAGPGSLPLKVATSSSKCAVAANAQNDGTGTIKLSIESAS